MANRSNRRQQNPRTAVGEKPELPMGSWRANSPSWPDLERSRSSRGRIYVSSRTEVAQDRSASKWGGAHIQPFNSWNADVRIAELPETGCSVHSVHDPHKIKRRALGEQSPECVGASTGVRRACRCAKSTWFEALARVCETNSAPLMTSSTINRAPNSGSLKITTSRRPDA
jgi:hypothetical protein